MGNAFGSHRRYRSSHNSSRSDNNRDPSGYSGVISTMSEVTWGSDGELTGDHDDDEEEGDDESMNCLLEKSLRTTTSLHPIHRFLIVTTIKTTATSLHPTIMVKLTICYHLFRI